MNQKGPSYLTFKLSCRIMYSNWLTKIPKGWQNLLHKWSHQRPNASIWGFPKIRGTPKWMVKIMENHIKNGWFGGKFLLFLVQHPYKIGSTHTPSNRWRWNSCTCRAQSPWINRNEKFETCSKSLEVILDTRLAFHYLVGRLGRFH